MIFDIHCHILPAVDDGARSEESTKRMLKIAAKEGITAIVATPHFACGRSEDKRQDIIQKYQMVSEWWKEYSPKKKFYLGNELFYSEGIVEALRQGKALTMNGTKYVLVEFPTYIDFRSLKKGVQSLLYAGYYPIVAHVERYECLVKKEKIQELIELGAYIQVNATAILGKHGFRAKFYVTKLLKQSLVHFVASDAHDSRERAPELKECALYLKKKLGKDKARQILEQNPMRMLKGEEL